jgi:hypothetical protein
MKLCKLPAGLRPCHYKCALIAAALVIPINAEAQDRTAITFGVGPVTATQSNSDFVDPFYVFSVQGIIKQHLVIEGEVAHWNHTVRTERGPHDIFGPNGRIGSVTGTTVVDTDSLWNLGVNVLLRSTGKVRVFGGGGAGVSLNDSEFSQQSFGCSATLDPRTCEPFENNRRRGPIPVFRVLGGVEVPVASHVGLFGAGRWETSTWEDRRTWVSATFGVRFSFN